jgi:hypothetical protein
MHEACHLGHSSVSRRAVYVKGGETNLHPFRLAVSSNSLCSLKQMLDLGYTCLLKGQAWKRPYMGRTNVGVRLVNERIQHLHGLPDTHAGAFLGLELDAGLDIKVESLFLYQGSELANGGC